MNDRSDKYSEVVVSFGSNTADKKANIVAAIDWFASLTADLKSSDIYETTAVGNGVGSYMNAVAIGLTSCDLAYLRAETKRYEERCGRDIECRIRGEVPIDIDIVMWERGIERPADYSHDFFQIGYSELVGSER